MLDFAIIGSGVSGGRIACDLTRAGARCVLIEAGREFGAQTFPREEIDSSTQLFWGGGLEISKDGRMGLLRARCVGGTSIVNQALLDRFDDLAWDDWRDRSGVEFLNAAEMDRHYAACEQQLSISEIPRQFWNRNAKIFTGALEARGYGWAPLHRAQKDCALEHGSDCMVCLGGCPRDSKQSSLVTTIRWARQQGLQLESEFEVARVVHSDDEVRVIGRHRGAEREIRARRVVLAAGALGNVGILARSGHARALPALGQGFTCHPQFMTYALFDEPVDAHKGAFQSVKSEDAKLRAAGLKLENVYAPPISTGMLFPGFGRRHQEAMARYRYYSSMEVAIRDEAVGRVQVDRSGKIIVDKKLTAYDQEKAEHGLALVKEFFVGAGARRVIQCRQAFGLHLMGGCAIGVNAASAVVAPDFSVHGFPNLFAADSSIFPSAPGINPSFTVMALSHRASQSIARAAGGGA